MRFAMRVAGLSTLLVVLMFSSAFGADSKNLEATPQAKAYRALLKAVDAGDFDAYKKCVTKEGVKAIDQQMKESGMEPKKGMELLKMLVPADVKFTSLKVDGKKATLEATGKVGGEMSKGTIPLEEEDGQWKVGKQSWTNAK